MWVQEKNSIYFVTSSSYAGIFHYDEIKAAIEKGLKE